MKPDLKTYVYLISALFIATLLAMVAMMIVFTGAINKQREAIGYFRSTNAELQSENEQLLAALIKGEQQEQPAGKQVGDGAVAADGKVDFGSGMGILSADYAGSGERKTGLKQKKAYLTFDGGPSGSTSRLLDVLKKHEVKATFFVVGNNTPAGKAVYRRIVQEGHVIGNNSYSYDFFKIYSTEEEFFEDFYRLQDLISETVGVIPEVYRFPGGVDTAVNKKMQEGRFMSNIISRLGSEGLTAIDWNVDSKDLQRNIAKNEMVEAVLSQAENLNEAIILMHDSDEKVMAIQALPEIIKGLTEMGFVFEVLTNKINTAGF